MDVSQGYNQTFEEENPTLVDLWLNGGITVKKEPRSL